ncbi:MAG TPA: heme o synthase [Candidatus Saccharimonadales bacterium]|nr:heme o synthase [Candidatus Saccharimonadales bacterium]
MKHKIRLYYSLTKPHVMAANAITAAAGFLLASNGHVRWGLFLALFAGSSLIIAAACALNNYLDRDIDSKMERTKQRVMVRGELSGRSAVTFSVVLLVLGVVCLALWTNWLVVAIGLAGFIDYVWLYGAWSKRRSIHGTLIGSISGAVPILAGYVAVTGRLDAGAALVFAVMFLWQMPEFYSISIYRRAEYKAANVPVISVVKGVNHTKIQIFVYTVAFVLSTIMLTAMGYTGYTYLAVMAALGIYWLWLAYEGLRTADSERWARRMFKFSLNTLLIFCLMISINWLLP